MKLLKCTLLFGLGACASLHAASISYFYGDSYAGDTRYTVTKLFDGNDDTLCWAASASSLLYYWQSSNAAYLPAGVPNGPLTQSLYSNDIFYTFTNSFVDAGGFTLDAISWWLTGNTVIGNYDYKTGPQASQGGYYSNRTWTENDMGDIVNVTSNTSLLGGVLSQASENDWLLALVISRTGAELNHVVSVWGYDIDQTLGTVTGLWISDSDETSTNSNFLMPIAWDELTARWIVTDGSLAEWALESIDVFYAPVIPEPRYAATLLLVGAAFVAVRRRHDRCRNKA